MQSIPRSCLATMNFRPSKTFLNPVGSCFGPDLSVGEGDDWFYEHPGMFAVAAMDMRSCEDYIMEYRQPDFISINYYDTISAEELAQGELFRMRCHKNMPLKGYALMLTRGITGTIWSRSTRENFRIPGRPSAASTAAGISRSWY